MRASTSARDWRASRLVTAGLMGTLLLTGCDGGAEPGEPTGGESPTSAAPSPPDDEGSSSSGDDMAQDTASASSSPLGVFEGAVEPTSTVRGTIPTVDGEVEVGVVSADVVGEHLRVVWAVRSADGSELEVDYLNGLQGGRRGTEDDTRAATLELPDGSQLQTLLTGRDERGTVVPLGCLCSGMPQSITGSWTVMTSSYPAPEESPETLTFRLPSPDDATEGISIEDVGVAADH